MNINEGGNELRLQASGMPTSLLYVPATRLELIAKANRSAARAIIVDLEDSVPWEVKEDALQAATHALTDETVKPVYVRVNPDPQRLIRELDTLARLPVTGVVLPKAHADSARVVKQRVPEHWQVISLVESASGLSDIHALAECSDGFAVGRADLIADLRISEDNLDGLLNALMPMVVAAATRGLPAPIAPAHLQVRDVDERQAREFSQRFYDAGFRSQTAIHPRYCALIHDVFIPSREEYETAKDLIQRMEDSARVGLDASGEFVDPAVLRRVQEVVERYEQR